jgi:hypothetical protein
MRRGCFAIATRRGCSAHSFVASGGNPARCALAPHRWQVERNIAYTTARRGGEGSEGGSGISTCEAWMASEDTYGTQYVNEVDGWSYTYEVRPPSSWRLDRTAQLQNRAQHELMVQRKQLLAANVNPRTARPVGCVLVLVRHGYSQFNARNRFTGWADAELTNRGRDEARLAGSMLREMGFGHVNRVYSSFLKRAIKTAWLMLDGMDCLWVPVKNTWRLNERHCAST